MPQTSIHALVVVGGMRGDEMWSIDIKSAVSEPYEYKTKWSSLGRPSVANTVVHCNVKMRSS